MQTASIGVVEMKWRNNEGMSRVGNAMRNLDRKGYYISYSTSAVGVWETVKNGEYVGHGKHVYFIEYEFDRTYNVVRYRVGSRKFTNLQVALDHALVLHRLGLLP